MIFTFFDFPVFRVFLTLSNIFVAIFSHLLELSITFINSISLSANCLAAVNKSDFTIGSVCKIIMFFYKILSMDIYRPYEQIQVYKFSKDILFKIHYLQ